MNLVEYYKKKNLLADGKGNTKIAKNSMKSFYLALLPHTLNSLGENLCKGSTKECRAMCLNASGMGGFDNVQEARRNKTEFFVQHKTLFLNKLWNELEKLNTKGNIAVRLNTISDVDWEIEFNNVGKSLKNLPNIKFYDYSKMPLKIENNDNPNYHFTFSFSGHNWLWCDRFLKEKKANIAVVFKNSLPLMWNGYRVIDATENDERFLDEKGVICGLKYKVPRGHTYQKNDFIIEI